MDDTIEKIAPSAELQDEYGAADRVKRIYRKIRAFVKWKCSHTRFG